MKYSKDMNEDLRPSIWQSGLLLVAIAIFSSIASVPVQAAPIPATSSVRSGQASGNYSASFSQAISSGGSVRETFSSGNVAVNQSRNSFAEMTGGTASYRNSNGTYNTITVPTRSGGGGGGGGTSSLVETGADDDYSYSCPTGMILVPGGCVRPGDSGPFGGTGYYENQCTSTGKGGCRYTPVWVPISAPAPQAPAQQQASVAPVVDISTSPSIIRAGGSSRVTWNGGAADECTVSGPGLSSTAISGSQVVDGIEEQSTYTLTCSSGTAVAQDTARVDIVPLWREI